MFVTINGYGYQRFDWPMIVADIEARKKKNEENVSVSEEEMEALEYKAHIKHLEGLKETAKSAAAVDLRS